MVVRWHWMAEKRLAAVYRFYRDTAGEKTARKIVSRIREEALKLATLPVTHAMEPLLEEEPNNYRSVVVKRRHKVVFYVDAEKETILVVDVWDCLQDPEKLKKRVKKTFED